MKHRDLREPGPYCVVGDESGHEYVIPVVRRGHWDKWLHSEEWEDGLVEWHRARLKLGNTKVIAHKVGVSEAQVKMAVMRIKREMCGA